MTPKDFVLSSLLVVGAMLVPVMSHAAGPIDFTAKTLPDNAIWMETLDMSRTDQFIDLPKPRQSFGRTPIKLSGVTYPHGVGVIAYSRIKFVLDGSAVRFESMVGVDDTMSTMGDVVAQVWVDGVKKADSGCIGGGDTPQHFSVDLTGAQEMYLVAEDCGPQGYSPDQLNWAGAMLILDPNAKSKPKGPPIENLSVPIASGVAPEPRINGPRVVGTTPGREFLFLIPASGEGPLEYAAEDLPAALSLDPATGIITGKLQEAGTHTVTLKVKGALGKAERTLTIIGGENKLARTPPMGWNSWNIWGCHVDDAKVRAAADGMVKSGMAAQGYQYINIDDCWQGERDANGVLHSNERFPDMKALADYVHSKGLKFGVYSSPGPTTCDALPGSYQHEEQDARMFAEWGVDYLKYDWCSYGNIAKKNGDVEELKKPYRVMRDALNLVDRDIVYAFCEYGAGKVWEWGAEEGGNLWRTNNDMRDSWRIMSEIGFNQWAPSPFAQPGHWNDPDMLAIGKTGGAWGEIHPTLLTANEQLTQMTLWSLLAAPLLIGTDLNDMDPFTVNLLTNNEVLDVDQDPLGKAALPVWKETRVDSYPVPTTVGLEVWSRPLSDGTLAVGLFNRNPKETEVTAKWSDLGLSGEQPVRDLWQKKDLGEFKDAYSVTVGAHGAALVKIGKPEDH